MKQIEVYARGACFFVLPSSQTSAGVWVGTDPVTVIDAMSSRSQKGETIRAALAKSRTGLAHAVDPEELSQWTSLLRVAGADSWSTFEAAARLVSISFDDEFRFFPWQAVRGKGFLPLPKELEVVCSADASSDELGHALDLVMTRSLRR